MEGTQSDPNSTPPEAQVGAAKVLKLKKSKKQKKAKTTTIRIYKSDKALLKQLLKQLPENAVGWKPRDYIHQLLALTTN